MKDRRQFSPVNSNISFSFVSLRRPRSSWLLRRLARVAGRGAAPSSLVRISSSCVSTSSWAEPRITSRAHKPCALLPFLLSLPLAAAVECTATSMPVTAFW